MPSVDPADDTPTIISLHRQRNSPADTADGLKGKKLGHFELVEPIGVGGMAAVIRANDLQLGRVVALKILPPEMAVDPENISRFRQEARAAAKLDHENVARVYFCGEDQGLHFIAFEFVEGTDLRSMMARGGPLPPAHAVKYMLQVAAGLAHAASRGVVHRDIKPSNIIITPEGRAKIVDMGLARSADGGVTQSGVTLGTFDYISPEQAIEPRSADVRSDIYSLGCTFYHLLTGQPPVPEGTAAKKLHHHQQVPPVDPRELNPAIPDELVAVLGKMMAKEPRDRYQRPEHLIQHLLAVAQKMNLPGDSSSQEAMLFVDAPLPQPPRFSPVLAAVAAVAAVAILAVILGAGNNGGSQPPPMPPLGRGDAIAVTGGGGNAPPNLAPGRPPVERGPRTAANEQELARLLDQNVEWIALTGTDYDLGSIVRSDAAGDRAASPLYVTHNLKLVGATPSGQRPVLRWKADGGPARDSDLALALLHVVASTSGLQVELKNLAFVVQGADSDAPAYAVSAAGVARLSVIDCEFTHDGKSDLPYGGAIRFDGPVAAASTLELDRCHFARGSCAVNVVGHGAVRASQCSFGPHDVAFLFSSKSVPVATNADRLLAELDHCTVLMREGTIIHVERNVAGTIRANNCLFARGGDRGEVVLVREDGPRDSEGRAAVVFAAPESGRNVYSGVACWATPAKTVASPEDCRLLGLPFRDAAGLDLPADRSPWKNADPLALLPDRPLDAFALRTDRPELRSRARPDEMIGVQRLPVGQLYPVALTQLGERSPEGPANVLIVDPDLDDKEARPRQFRTMSAALNGRMGDVTVLIRHNGPLELEPVALAQMNLRLTIKPAEGYHPVLVLRPNLDVLNPALFSVHNGSLAFKDVQFRLRPAPENDSKWISVAAISGAGQVSFEDCVATLGADDERQPVQALPALVTLTTDPDAAVGERRPKVRLKDCVVRGRGHLVAVRGSRPVELEADNVLAVLRGSFLVIAGQNREPPLLPQSQLTCRHVTAYLTEPFLDLLAAESDKKIAGLVPTQVKCDDCLLVAANDHPLVFASGVDRDTLTRTLLSWESTRTLYGNYQKMLDVNVRAGPSGMMMPTEWTARDWLQFTRAAEEDSFPHVNFARSPVNEAGFLKAAPHHFRARLLDMKRTDMSTAFGAELDQLPRLDDE